MLYYDTRLAARQSEGQIAARGLDASLGLAHYGIYPMSTAYPEGFDFELFYAVDGGDEGTPEAGFKIKWEAQAKPIDEVLPVLKARVTAKKHAVEDGGIILPNGVAIDTAAEDRARVAQIMIMLMQDGSENSLAGLKFKTSTGEFVPVKADDIKAIYAAIKALTLGVFAREAEITGLLDAAEHADEAIEAYADEIGKGWPVTDMRPAAPASTETTTAPTTATTETPDPENTTTP